MIVLKACPKCRGDVVAEIDEFDDLNLTCFQCGYSLRGAERRSLVARIRSGQRTANARRAS
jgi:ribosomal protein S27AE